MLELEKKSCSGYGTFVCAGQATGERERVRSHDDLKLRGSGAGFNTNIQQNIGDELYHFPIIIGAWVGRVTPCAPQPLCGRRRAEDSDKSRAGCPPYRGLFRLSVGIGISPKWGEISTGAPRQPWRCGKLQSGPADHLKAGYQTVKSPPFQKHSTVSFFGPCAPSTRMRSMSPVRLGPVMNEIMLG